MTDFPEVFYRLLPGIYRQKDVQGELRQLLQILAQPASELEQSIGQLYLDLFVESCRPEFLPFIGDLVGAQVDTTEPVAVQRTTLADRFALYRSKGLGVPLAGAVQSVSTWATVPVDFSQMVARLPFVGALEVVRRRRAVAVAEIPTTSGRFFFDAGQAVTPLYDELRGRPIRRSEIATIAAEIVGTDAGFTIYDRGVALIGPKAPSPLTVVGADLTDFANPKDPGGSGLVVAANQVAVDPVLGRFLITSPKPLVADVTVDFHQLVPGATVPQTFDIRDSARMAQLGRSDDPAPYTLDLRSPDLPTDGIGRTFYDNHGFFLTVGVAVANQRPTLLVPGTFSGFSFDSRPLASSDTVGHPLQLQDGIDGSPITRGKLLGNEAAYFDTARGFTIRDLATSLRDPDFPIAVRLRSADLGDFANPKDPAGGALVLADSDVAIDPQLGRFLINLSAIGVPASRLRVGYLLAPAVRVSAGTAVALGPGPSVFAFATDAAMSPLRDAFDGTPLSVKLRLGAVIDDFHGTKRGYVVSRNGVDVSGTLAPELTSLDAVTATASANKLALDLDRGRFAFPAAFLQPTDVITVDYSAEDRVATDGTFQRVAQQMPRMTPAGVTPVLIDTRRPKVDPKNLH